MQFYCSINYERHGTKQAVKYFGCHDAMARHSTIMSSKQVSRLLASVKLAGDERLNIVDGQAPALVCQRPKLCNARCQIARSIDEQEIVGSSQYLFIGEKPGSAYQTLREPEVCEIFSILNIWKSNTESGTWELTRRRIQSRDKPYMESLERVMTTRPIYRLKYRG
ncbi:hypothetical protein RRG08_043084 [Elysia crispata]|uniref:Uncharacterized protein n=1 Tax=Elysia crispata TaxID=231223 RepID=A0AAE0XY72_9GAST|nr:hypothetical protein RRG08_043084 [Elysia crispata]